MKSGIVESRNRSVLKASNRQSSVPLELFSYVRSSLVITAADQEDDCRPRFCDEQVDLLLHMLICCRRVGESSSLIDFRNCYISMEARE